VGVKHDAWRFDTVGDGLVGSIVDLNKSVQETLLLLEIVLLHVRAGIGKSFL
jgi:hypothetical protein